MIFYTYVEDFLCIYCVTSHLSSLILAA